MEKSELLKWLDKVIDLHKELYKIHTLYNANSEEFCTLCGVSFGDEVHIYSGIIDLASACNQKLKTSLLNTTIERDRPLYETYFTYRDMKIFELFDEGDELR